MQFVMTLHANVLKISYFYYRIIDRITEFSFIIFLDFIYFMERFILSTMDYHLLFFFTVTNYILHFIIRMSFP